MKLFVNCVVAVSLISTCAFANESRQLPLLEDVPHADAAKLLDEQANLLESKMSELLAAPRYRRGGQQIYNMTLMPIVYFAALSVVFGTHLTGMVGKTAYGELQVSSAKLLEKSFGGVLARAGISAEKLDSVSMKLIESGRAKMVSLTGEALSGALARTCVGVVGAIAAAVVSEVVGRAVTVEISAEERGQILEAYDKRIHMLRSLAESNRALAQAQNQ